VSGKGSRGEGLRGIYILGAPTFLLNRGPAWSKSGPEYICRLLSVGVHVDPGADRVNEINSFDTIALPVHASYAILVMRYLIAPVGDNLMITPDITTAKAMVCF